MATGQSYGENFLAEGPSSQVTLVCVIYKAYPAQETSKKIFTIVENKKLES